MQVIVSGVICQIECDDFYIAIFFFCATAIKKWRFEIIENFNTKALNSSKYVSGNFCLVMWQKYENMIFKSMSLYVIGHSESDECYPGEK